jgi:GNAT superfamily N-acetyltransferase
MYALSTGTVAFDAPPRSVQHRLPRCPVPVVQLTQLAVEERMRGRRLGGALLVDALLRALALAREQPVVAVEVSAKSESDRAFYERYGFIPLEDDPRRLFLPVETIRQLFAPAIPRK